MALKFPPTVNVAEVSTTVCSPKSFSRSRAATESGATATESSYLSERVSHTTS